MKTNPASRVGQPFAHPQAAERGSRCDQFGGRIASRARERHHADPPAAPKQPFGEQDRLALRAAQAVEAGNEQGNVAQSRRSLISVL